MGEEVDAAPVPMIAADDVRDEHRLRADAEYAYSATGLRRCWYANGACQCRSIATRRNRNTRTAAPTAYTGTGIDGG